VIGPLLRISWLALVRDRWALVLSFVVPIAFFSILALVFGGIGDRRLPTVRLAVLDEDRTDASALLATRVDGEPLDDELVAGSLRQLLIAAHVAPTALIGSAVLHLARDPALQATLREQPARLVGNHPLHLFLKLLARQARRDRLQEGQRDGA